MTANLPVIPGIKPSTQLVERRAEKFSVDFGGVLAKILAEEKIYLEIQPQAETAWFQPKERILVLPDWNVRDDTFKFLVTHECAHAIYTPSKGWVDAIERHPKEEQVFYQMILNVVEDCRIDKMVKEKYPGTKRWYLKGISDIITTLDFFGINRKGKDGKVVPMNERALADRINIFFKTMPVDNCFDVQFDPVKEQPIVDRIHKVRTFEEVVKIADELYVQFKQENKELMSNIKKFSFTIKIGKPGSSNGTGSGKPFNPQAGVHYDITIDPSAKGQPTGIKELDDAIKDALGSIASQAEELGDMKSTSKDASHNYLKEYFYAEDPTNYKDSFINVDSLNNSYRSQPTPNKDYINYMAMVFERRMKARDFAKISVSKTGMLDMKSLPRFRTEEDIFLRNEITTDNKNHGVIMVVDCSSSMSNIFRDVIEHTYKLVMFCDRIKIPYKVFGFTDRLGKNHINKSMFHQGGNFGLINMFDSNFGLKRNKDNFEKLMGFNNLGGTPLSTAINFIKKIGEDFKIEKRIDVLNVLFLTDGACTCSNVYDFIVDKKTRIVKPTGEGVGKHRDNTPALYKILRERLNCNVYNYFLIEQKDQMQEVKQEYCGTTATFFVDKKLFRDKHMASKMLINRLVENMAVLNK
jgi:hypothetical protein